MKTGYFYIFILLLVACASSENSNKDQTDTNEYALAWGDEFNYNGLPDTTKWNYDVGGQGWGNHELQYYTRMDTMNAKVENGILKIIARRQKKESNEYTSARLLTKGKGEFTYGKIEARVKLPAGKGAWPAVWMLGTNIDKVDWPTCGEIDIMEHVGFTKDSVFGTIHTETYNHMNGTQKGKAFFIADPYSRFHVYSIEWTPEKIDFMVDEVVYNRIANEHLTSKEWPFNQSFFLIMNLAIGGDWGGKHGVDEHIFPAVMEVDYVRVFQKLK